MSNTAAAIIVSVMGLAVMAPVAAEKFNRSSKGDTPLNMPANDDYTSAPMTPMFSTAGGSSPTPCPADLNHDGFVNGADMAILLGAWGPCSSSNCPADLNHSGVVDGADLSLLLGAWGACPV
jgi:hypothetical protein